MDYKIEWHQGNESESGRAMAEWYKHTGHDMVVSVSDDKGNTITVFADGEMRYNIYEMRDGKIEDVGVVRYWDDFQRWGITTDEDINDLAEADIEWHGGNILLGPNDKGFYIEGINNPWFDAYLYRDGSDPEHLDCVCFDINEALSLATESLEAVTI